MQKIQEKIVVSRWYLVVSKEREIQMQKIQDKIVVSRHGRTASYLTAPAQIPACGIIALGSSEILASVKVKLIRFKLIRKLCNSRFLNIIEFCNLVKYIIAEAALLTTPIQPLVKDSHRLEEKLLQTSKITDNPIIVVITP